MKLAAIAIVVGAACNSPTSSTPLPWISGLAATDVSEIETVTTARRLARIVGTEDDGGYGAIAVSASFGTILASYTQGIAVVDASDRMIARAPGFAHEGSADDLVALATGSGQLDKPVIVLAVTRGGHRESTTSIVVYQLGDHGRLDQLFDAPIEERDGDDIVAGSLTFVPRGLLYRAPTGSLEQWRFDPSRRKYVRDRQLTPQDARDHNVPVL